MKLRTISILLLALAVEFGFLAYLNPLNAWRWTFSMTLCR